MLQHKRGYNSWRCDKYVELFTIPARFIGEPGTQRGTIDTTETTV